MVTFRLLGFKTKGARLSGFHNRRQQVIDTPILLLSPSLRFIGVLSVQDGGAVSPHGSCMAAFCVV